MHVYCVYYAIILYIQYQWNIINQEVQVAYALLHWHTLHHYRTNINIKYTRYVHSKET